MKKNSLKYFFCLSVLLLIGFIFPLNARAAILNIRPDGSVVLNVLASEDSIALGIPKNESLQITQVAQVGQEEGRGKISLSKNGDKFSLSVSSASGEKNLDVTGIKDDLIQIETRPKVQNVEIGLSGERFIIRQENISALTDFPISVDPAGAEISLQTLSGIRYLAILPKEALENTLKARLLNKLNDDQSIQIAESTDGQISYNISGQKTLNVFNLLNYDVPVSVSVSALTGEILKVDQPSWLKIAGFIFS